MKKRMSKVLAILLIACLSLSACGKKEQVKPKETKEEAASVEKGELKSDSKVIAVGNTTVSYDEYQAYSYILRNRFDNMLDANVWNYSVSPNQTIGKDATTDTIRLIIQLKVMNKSAQSQGVVLGANEKEELTYEAEKYVQSLPEEVRNQYKITAQLVTNMLCDNEIARKLYDVVTGKVDVNITDTEAQVVETQAICLMTKGVDKTGGQINADEATKAVLFEKAKELQGQAQADGFYALAEANSSLSEIELNLGPEDSPKELVDAAFTMQPGQISEVITTDSGYYILNCLSVNKPAIMEQHKEELIVEKQTKAFQDAYNGWAKKYGVHVSKSLLK